VKSLERLLLITCILFLSILTILFFKPWLQSQFYIFQYFRRGSVEVAEAIERKHEIRLNFNWITENCCLNISIIKPNEKPINIELNYSRLKIHVPTFSRNVEIIRGSSTDKRFERFRRISIYHNASWIIIDPKPIVNFQVSNEYDRRVHTVQLIIFLIKGRLEAGSTLSYAYSHRVNYLRTYDYAGKIKVNIDGNIAVDLQVKRGEVLRLTIICEVWNTNT